MATEVVGNEAFLHEENKFYFGNLVDVVPEDGQFGPQNKWVIELDNEIWTEDDGTERPMETWVWCSQKLTTHPKNKFRKFVKGLTGAEPVEGEIFHEEHYTTTFYSNNPDANPVELTGREDPWRVAVMFEHYKANDGTTKEKVTILVSEVSTQ